MKTLAQQRRQRLSEMMRGAGITQLLLYGNAWQGDYLRYGSDFGILEGHGIALVSAAGEVDLFLDSATDAERAEVEAPDVRVHFAPNIAGAVGARLERMANERLAAAPRRFVPRWLVDPARGFSLDDATALVDKLQGEIAAVRTAAQIADEAYGEFRRAVRPGRRQFEIVADIEAHLRRRGCPDNFMIIGSGGKDIFGMTPPS